MRIVDLRQMNSRQLEPLLEEEACHWRAELHWDYRGSLELIKKFLDAHSLAGCAALEDGQAAGYCFYVLEEHKGLAGGVYVSPRFPQLAIGQKLLGEMFTTLRTLPQVERIEAQLMPFGCAYDQVLVEHGFRLYNRQFMRLLLEEARCLGAPLSPALRLERWSDRDFERCARLIHLAYANHVDGEINDQYRSEGGALKFLKNIVVLPGCGQFQPEASFVLHQAGSEQLLGVVLTSAVSSEDGHTTQICVQPDYQRHGLGRQLIEASIQALHARGFSALSLTVTSVNATAVRLYEHLGFRTIKTFAAGVWQA
jgi:ribosomal protein S18 acetylase RimI-like enzyme